MRGLRGLPDVEKTKPREDNDDAQTLWSKETGNDPEVHIGKLAVSAAIVALGGSAPYPYGHLYRLNNWKGMRELRRELRRVIREEARI